MRGGIDLHASVVSRVANREARPLEIEHDT